MMRSFTGVILAAAALAAPAFGAEQNDAELAQQLNNPVSSLISLPLQFNYDCCYGPGDGWRGTLNLQPVVPVSISSEWNMIVRTIVPIVYQDRTAPNAGSTAGVGDVLQSFFFSPKAPTKGGLIWAVGPVFNWPIGGDQLGSKKWGAGPTALVLKQAKGWTVGVLANQVWSYADAGGGDHPAVNHTFVQPFLSYTTAKHTTYGLNTESTYNWKTRAWTVPINLTVAQLYNFGGQRVQLTGGARVYAAHEDQGPGWGLRFAATFLFPK